MDAPLSPALRVKPGGIKTGHGSIGASLGLMTAIVASLALWASIIAAAVAIF